MLIAILGVLAMLGIGFLFHVLAGMINGWIRFK